MKRLMGHLPRFVTSFWNDTSGFVIVYVAIMLPVIVGFSAVALDAARHMTLQTQLQAAADAIALAGARELDGKANSDTRAIGAMAHAYANAGTPNTLRGMGTAPTLTYTYAFYKSLPAATEGIRGDDTSITDLNRKYVAVTVAPVTLPTIFNVRDIFPGAISSFSADAQAIAGFTGITVCNVVPIFICNPYEAANNTNDAAATTALYSNLATAATIRRQLRLDRSKTSPGHFGWVQTADGCNNANCMQDNLAKVTGACYNSYSVTLATGNKNNVDAYFDTRFDIYQKAGDIKAVNAPSINVRKGYFPAAQNWCSANPQYNSALSVQAFYTSPMSVTTGTTANTSQQITSVANTANLVPNQYIAGDNIPFGAQISSVSGTTVFMSTPAKGTNSGLTFYMPAPSGSPGVAQCFNTTNNSATLTPTTSITKSVNSIQNNKTTITVSDLNCVVIGATVTVASGNNPFQNNTIVASISNPTCQALCDITISKSTTKTVNNPINVTFTSIPIVVSPGEFIAGTGIPGRTTVTSVNGNTSITISNNATLNASNSNLVFFWLESPLLQDKQWTGVCDASTGFCSQGNGDWDCLLYWKANHPNVTPPAQCTSSNPTYSRYQIYRYEIANNLINDWSGNHLANTTGNSGNGENGAPLCAAGSGISGVDLTTGGLDRRNMIVAIVNCAAQTANGNIKSGNSTATVPVAGFGKFFLTQPFTAFSNLNQSQQYLYGEMTGIVSVNDNVSVMSQVQMYR